MLYGDPINDLWEASRTVQDPQIPTLPLESPVALSVALDPGAYAKVGADISTPKTMGLSLEPGSYVVTGAPLSTSAGLGISLDPGAYSQTGFEITFLLNISPPLDAGSYSISGAELGVFYNRRLEGRARITARAGLLRANTGRAGACFETYEFVHNTLGQYLYSDDESDVAADTEWVDFTDDESGGN